MTDTIIHQDQGLTAVKCQDGSEYLFQFNQQEGAGTIRLQRGPYGMELYLNDSPYPIALIDLFHCSTIGKTVEEHHHDPQLVIYNTDPECTGDDAMYFVRQSPAGTLLESP